MKFVQLGVLLPCQNLEDVDLPRKDEDAEQLLSAWSALWHPSLLKAAGRLPRWLSLQSPPTEPARHLLILPSCSESSLPENWLSETEAAGACVVRAAAGREEMLTAVLQRAGLNAADVDADSIADFLALGYCHMQIELLGRKLNYMINLDESAVQTAVLAAADEAIAGNRAGAREHLQAAFDRLHDAREHSYQTEPRFLDLTLLARSTLGPGLRAELAGTVPRNFLICGELVEELARREPETLEAMKQALVENRCAILGGEYAELPLPLLDPEAVANQLQRGLAAYQRHLQTRPAVFARRRFGLTPALPQVLAHHDFSGAFHCTLDDGHFPSGRQSRVQWEGIDGTTIEAIGCLPVDAGRATTFLRFAETLGDAMNLDHTTTVVFAHWPGRVNHCYEDLRRITAYGAVLGSFLTITDYFEQTKLAGQRQNYLPDEYRSPYLKQDAAAGLRRDPVSRWVHYFRRRLALDASQTLGAISAMCRPTAPCHGEEAKNSIGLEESLVNNDECDADLDCRLAESLKQNLTDLAKVIVPATVSADRGTLWINPWSVSQVVGDCSSFGVHPIEVPAMGFAWVSGGPCSAGVSPAPTCSAGVSPAPAAGTAAPQGPGAIRSRRSWFGRRRTKGPPPLAEDNLLRNEFCEIRFDPTMGAIRAISDYRSRDPRLAQQIALRTPQSSDPAADANYTIMAAEKIEITSSGPMLGEMVARGRLVDHNGHRVAGFCQTTRLRRGSRIIELQIDLDVDRQPGTNPWDSYYAARFAWKDEAAELRRSVSMASVPTKLTQFESPHFLDIVRDDQHTTLLMGGVPYHRRIGPRKLDTLLIPRGETERSFRLGIGIDVPNPMSAALAFVMPPLILADQPSPRTPTGWLFHLDARNVLATHWEALHDAGTTEENSPGLTAAETANERNKAGFRVRLLETEGCGVRLGLRCFRAVASAKKINRGEAPDVELQVEGDRINIPIGPHQWIEVEARFA